MKFLKKFLVVFLTVLTSIIFVAPIVAAEKPLVALLNKKIQTQDSAIIVEKVVIYPDENSLYGQGQENYGMPVKEEYGKGPLVVLDIEKYPNYPRGALTGLDWIEVELFSDGKSLGKSGGGETEPGRMVFAFNFYVPVDMSVSSDGAIELEQLGDLELKITLFKVVKFFDLPTHDLPRGKNPIYEDESVQLWEAKWKMIWNDYDKRKITTLDLKLRNKTESASYDLTFQAKGSPKYLASGRADYRFYPSLPKSELAGAQLWKIVPGLEKTISSLKFIPQ
jgi:hypothetical protein